jgi:hypothetical protein
MMNAKRHSAAFEKIEFDLTVDDLHWPSHCPVFRWIELQYPGRYHFDPAGATFDRRDRAKGYVRGNTIVVGWHANRLRSDAEPDELARVAQYYSWYDDIDLHVEAIEAGNRYGVLDDDTPEENK